MKCAHTSAANNIYSFTSSAKNHSVRNILIIWCVSGAEGGLEHNKIYRDTREKGFCPPRNPDLCTVGIRLPTPIKRQLLNQRVIYVEHSACTVVDRVHVIRCYTCQGFHHTSETCVKDAVCAHCAGGHATKDCSVKLNTNFTPSCINCKLEGHENVSHAANSQDCPVYKSKYDVAKSKNDVIDNDIDAICLTETWLNLSESAIESEVQELGYKLISRSRGSRGGGVAILMRKSFHHVQVTHSFSSFECVETLITHPQIKPLRLLGVYRPPSSPTALFLDEFETLLHELSGRSGEIVFTGDFNIHIHDSSSTFTKSFLQLLDDHLFHQFVNEPTHIAGGILDLVVAKSLPSSSPISNVEANMIPAVPDHALVSFNLQIGAPTKRKNYISVEKRNIKSLDLDSFRSEILKSPLCDVDIFTTNLDETIELLEELLTEFLDELAPIVETIVPEEPSPRGYNSGCQDAKRRRRAAERRYRASLKKSVCIKQLLDALRTLREESKAATKVIVGTRNDYYRDRLEEAGNDSKKTYRIMNGLLGQERPRDKRGVTTSKNPTLPSPDFNEPRNTRAKQIRASTIWKTDSVARPGTPI
eukprot:sb/3463289/